MSQCVVDGSEQMVSTSAVVVKVISCSQDVLFLLNI